MLAVEVVGDNDFVIDTEHLLDGLRLLHMRRKQGLQLIGVVAVDLVQQVVAVLPTLDLVLVLDIRVEVVPYSFFEFAAHLHQFANREDRFQSHLHLLVALVTQVCEVLVKFCGAINFFEVLEGGISCRGFEVEPLVYFFHYFFEQAFHNSFRLNLDYSLEGLQDY